MRIFDLKMKGIGPFKEEYLQFIGEEDSQDKPPVVIITGENGTGKTIVLDAIRGLLFGAYQYVGRDIFNGEEIILSSKIAIDNQEEQVSFTGIHSHNRDNRFFTTAQKLNQSFGDNKAPFINVVVNYWLSNLATDSFDIKNIVAPDIKTYLTGALSGHHKNISVTQLICYFDYLRGSEAKTEKRLGEFLYQKLKAIIKLSLNNGKLAYVSRSDLMPIIEQNGKEITLDKLSSGNLYLIQRMVALLGQMHAVNRLNNLPIESLCETRGLLLIDEAENHLHPKWQKTFICNILEIFPNLQIILTTHSPFIVSSVENAKVFVCEARHDHCIIEDATEEYASKPIEEILLSPLFGETLPFNEPITNLLNKRKKAIEAGNYLLRKNIENQLQRINPQYFAYFDVDNLLEQLTAKN